MSVPATFKSALQNNDSIVVQRWIEIEGIPRAYGTVTKSSTWFTARAAANRFEGIDPYLARVPANFDADLDPLVGIASVMGQIEFHLVDVDGQPTAWCGNRDASTRLKLAADITAAATTITYTGNPPTFTNSLLYIGSETIRFTTHDTVAKQFTGCTRALYRSKAQAFAAGIPIGSRPYAMFGRRVWYYQTAHKQGGTVATDADKALRFSGTLENIYLDDSDPGVFVVPVVSLEKELTRQVFRDLRTYTDTENKGIVGNDFAEPGIRFANESGGSSTSADLNGGDVAQTNEDSSQHFPSSTPFRYAFLVDNEVIFFSRSNSPNKFTMTSRAAFGTTREAHSPGFTMKEIAWIARWDITNNSTPDEHYYSRFLSAQVDGLSPCNGDHPLLVLLQILLSTGTATNYVSGRRNYDVLPESWGLGIDISRVDVDGIEKLSIENPDLSIGGYISEPVSFIELAKQILAPFGFFALTTIGDVWTIRQLRPPRPDEAVRSITTAHIINKSKPAWDGNLSGLVQEVVFDYNRDTEHNRFLNNTLMINGLGKVFAQKKGRRLTYQMPLVYEKGAKAAGRPPLSGMAHVEGELQKRIDFFKQGYAIPPPVLTLRCRYDLIDVEPGDVVSVTLSTVPNAGTGLRGLNAQVMRVLRKRVDDGAKVVELTMQDTGYSLGDYRRIAPSAQVATVTTLTANDIDVTFEANEFTSPNGGGLDVAPVDNGGAHEWIGELLDNGSSIRLVSADFAQEAIFDVKGWDGTTLNLTGASVPAWIVAGCYAIPLNYVADAGVLSDEYAFCVDADGLLGAGDNAHKYSP